MELAQIAIKSGLKIIITTHCVASSCDPVGVYLGNNKKPLV